MSSEAMQKQSILSKIKEKFIRQAKKIWWKVMAGKSVKVYVPRALADGSKSYADFMRDLSKFGKRGWSWTVHFNGGIATDSETVIVTLRKGLEKQATYMALKWSR